MITKLTIFLFAVTILILVTSSSLREHSIEVHKESTIKVK